MSNQQAKKDDNSVSSLLGVSNVDHESTVQIYADPTTHRLLTEGVGQLDAFSRLRVSNPETLFEVQTQYGVEPFKMEAGVTGTGLAATHDANTRLVAVAVATGTGTSFYQSYQYSPYQPGKSQFLAMTFVIGAAVSGAVVDVGYFDLNNGVIFRQNGTTNLQIGIRTSTSGSAVDTFINQSSWNLDPLNGTGPSRVTLDITKSQILVLDLQYLGMGRVRVGFDIGGDIIYAHEFMNANNLSLPYMQQATLPVQMLVTGNSLPSTKTSYFKCATVVSEGGFIEDFGYSLSTPQATAVAGSGARVPLIAIRPKTTFNSITNRELFIAEQLNIIITGTNPIFWELVIGGTFSGQTFADINTAASAFEYTSVPGSYTNLTGGIVIASGYAPQGTVGTGPIGIAPLNIDLVSSLYYPIALNRAGAATSQGTLTLLVTGIGGTAGCQGSINFKEIR